ncbi:hypothetical protein AB6A40_008905 [Gnathostoma spinigerum]|uniref:MADF domain-containing protein n=1 Tax=Gnathostoma spinigerum TaxID=75299 RepID=A0ABD6EXI9_9BILA
MSLNLRRLNKRSPKFVTLEVVNAQPQNRRQAVTSQQKYRIIEVPRTAKSQGAPNSAGTQTVVVTTRSAVKVDMSGGSMPQQQAVSGCVSSSQEDIFVRRLIEAVKAEPCLYNPNHEHYGNKHSSAQYRSAVWRRLCIDLNFQGDLDFPLYETH